MLFNVLAAVVILIYLIVLYQNLVDDIPEEDYEDLSDDEFNQKYRWQVLGPMCGIAVVSIVIIIYNILIAGL